MLKTDIFELNFHFFYSTPVIIITLHTETLPINFMVVQNQQTHFLFVFLSLIFMQAENYIVHFAIA